MVKRTHVASGVLLFAALRGVSKAVAVGALGVSVCVDGHFDLEGGRKEEEGWEEFLYVLGVNGDNHRTHFFGYCSSTVLVKVPGRTDLNRFGVEDGLFEEGKQLVVIVREDIGWDRVNCQLYSGWRQREL